MKSVRRPIVAISAMFILVALQAVADPTGLLALVGFSGAVPALATGFWSFSPYIVFLPVLMVMTWWVARRAADRFWTLSAGLSLAVLIAQAAMALSMTGNILQAGWSAGFATAKAIPAALIVATITRWLGGKSEPTLAPVKRSWLAALLFASLAPIFSGLWWTGAVYAPGIPTPRPDTGIVSVLISMLLMWALGTWCIGWMRARVPGVLGGWLGVLVAGGAFGIVQAIVGFVVDRGPGGDIWPLMVSYITLADGMAFGASVGWIVGLFVLLVDVAQRSHASIWARAPQLAVASTAALAIAASLFAPGLSVAAQGKKNIPSAGILRATNSHISDGEGNQVLLRGVNVNQLVDFYQPQADVPATRPLTEADFAGMAAQGFNVSRLNISWSALEPTRGTLNPEYLQKITQAVDWAKKYGIYTVLDMHQDGWWNAPSEPGTSCRPGTELMWGYDGAPTWATYTDQAPRCQFTGRDISAAGNRAFQNFYFDTDGVQSALASTWGKLASQFRDEPMVAGFDLLNEPGFGETAPVTTSHLLGKFYAKAIDEIRAVGAQQIVFVEPSIFWSGLGFDSGPTPGFTEDSNIVYSPHLYAESITMDRDLGIPAIVSLERQFILAQRNAAEYAAPLWSGEYGYWGAADSQGGEDEESLSRLRRYANTEDEHRLGSAYWVWKQACGDPQNGIGPYGNALMMQDCIDGADLPPKAGLLKILSRAYPQAAPGTITSLKAETASLELAGQSPTNSCGLRVWFPGENQPNPQVTGLTGTKLTKTEGGWIFTACAQGDYSVSNQP